MIQSGSICRSSDSVEAVWTSLMPKSSMVENFNEDEDVIKLSLLLKSTQLLLTGLRQKQLRGSSEVNSLKVQLQAVTRKKEQYETDAKNLRKELSDLKFELQSSDLKAKKFQKEAESASVKWKQLQSRISSEVETRLNAVFKACLQQNNAVTVQQMMTQLQTQPQFTDFPTDEWPAAKVQQVAELAGKDTINAKTHSSRENLEAISPDKSLILDTPDACKRSTFQRHKSDKNDFAKPRHLAEIMNSVASSPDEIAPTPPSASNKQESKRRGKNKKIFKSDEAIIDQKEPVVYAVDTQDVDEPVNQRSVLKENIIIPETFNPENCEEQVEYRPSSRRDKENGSSLTSTGHHDKKSPSGTPVNVKSPSTPSKAQTTRDPSPIFGGNSGSKKIGARNLNISLGSSSKKQRFRSSSFAAANAVDTSYRRTESGKRKMSVQPTITSYVDNMNGSKLNSSKSNRSTKLSLQNRKHLGSKAKKSTGADLSKTLTHLSEEEQIELAISKSHHDNYSHLTDDSDATMFEPISPARTTKEPLQGNVQSAVTSTISLKDRHDFKDSEGAYFEPMYASTEKEFITPTKRRKPMDNFEGTLQSQFKPPFVSTQKVSMDNSALNEFVELLDEKNLDDTPPRPIENSYNHLPKKNKTYGKVRKKLERKNLPALECTQCGRFFAAAFGDDDKARREIVNSCSRHRDRIGAGASPVTPPGYWDPGWRSPQDANKA
ncbi:uncharacterized protein LOC117646394 [Thrips palmi]|uniref:Uncharacterized protein LOC117646394 n=1 Tax=Thrips palmi TaxID=161013 RepID=A0A6P8ZNY8_THRPL|nr:uncharacterized protein LOC117646394 [Thrips palmi]